MEGDQIISVNWVVRQWADTQLCKTAFWKDWYSTNHRFHIERFELLFSFNSIEKIVLLLFSFFRRKYKIFSWVNYSWGKNFSVIRTFLKTFLSKTIQKILETVHFWISNNKGHFRKLKRKDIAIVQRCSLIREDFLFFYVDHIRNQRLFLIDQYISKSCWIWENKVVFWLAHATDKDL